MKYSIRVRVFILFLAAILLMACGLMGRLEPGAGQPPTSTAAPVQPSPTSAPPQPTPTAVIEPTQPPTALPPAPATAAAPTAAPTSAVLPTMATRFAKDQVIGFAAGTMQSTVDGSVNQGSYDRYRMSLAAGESLNIQLSSTQQTAGFALLGPDQKPMKGSENQEARWYSASVQDSGEYAIIVGSELGRADYSLVVTLGQPAGTPTSSVGSYAPLPAGDCKQVRSQARNALGVTFSMSEAGFNAATGERGIACVLAANGTGTNFSSVDAAMSALLGAFGGWSSDSNLAADGATGASRGLRRGNDLMLVTVQWQPAASAQCPADQPISACNLTPEQQLYTVVIQAARR
jgi:hypothetical protein